DQLPSLVRNAEAGDLEVRGVAPLDVVFKGDRLDRRIARNRVERLARREQPSRAYTHFVETTRLVERNQPLAIGLPLDERKAVALSEAQLASKVVFRKLHVAGEANAGDACAAHDRRSLPFWCTKTRFVAKFVGPALVVQKQRAHRNPARREVR